MAYAYTLQSWDDFLNHPVMKAVEPAFKTDMLFRGQSSASRPLWPSLLRAIGGPNHVNAVRALELEKTAGEEFRSKAYPFLPTALLTEQTSIVRWWMIMQHYGAPTRLLDWSLSPYIATYFACSGSETENGAIWALNMKADDYSMPAAFDLKTSKIDKFFQNPRAQRSLHILLHGPQNERMIAQQGVFMLSASVNAEHDEILSELSHPSSKRWTFGKLIVPSRLKPQFLRNLSIMNIDARSLFPGIEGLGKSVFDIIRLEAATSARRQALPRRPRPS